MRFALIAGVVGALTRGVTVRGQDIDDNLKSASASHVPKVLAATQAPLGVESSDAGGEAPTPTATRTEAVQTAQKVFTLTTLTTTPPADIKSTPVPGFSFPPGTLYETATRIVSVTSGLMPIPTGVNAGTEFVFPGASSWCKYGKTRVMLVGVTVAQLFRRWVTCIAGQVPRMRTIFCHHEIGGARPSVNGLSSRRRVVCQRHTCRSLKQMCSAQMRGSRAVALVHGTSSPHQRRRRAPQRPNLTATSRWCLPVGKIRREVASDFRKHDSLGGNRVLM